VTRGRLPQRAGLPGLNGSGAAATVPPDGWTSAECYDERLAVSEGDPDAGM